MKRGLLIVYICDGKGEITPALGQVFRALGQGLRVCVLQFDKGSPQWKELTEAGRFGDLLDIHVLGKGFTWKAEDREKDIEIARAAWEFAKEIINSGKYEMVVLDEITHLITYQLIGEADVVRFLHAKPENVHLIATGGDAVQSLMEAADLVTEVRETQPDFRSGTKARKGSGF